MRYYVFICLLSQLDFAFSRNGRIVCYYPNWGVYRSGTGRFHPKDIDPYLCTHLIYSFGDVLLEDATIAASDKTQDLKNRGFADFNDLKMKYNQDLKTLFAVGGYQAGSTDFTSLAQSSVKRRAFARNSLEFLRRHKFDGLNIDWQFPNDEERGGIPEDYMNFVRLLKEINKAYVDEAEQSGNQKLLLTISVPGLTRKISAGYNLIELEKYVEFMNVLAYDYHLSSEETAYHHSPLYPLPEEMKGSDHENEGLNADSTIDYILSKGVKPATLNLGIPLYGRTFTLENENENKVGSPATGRGKNGPATREDGYIAYYEICENIKEKWQVTRANKTAMGPYAYKGNQWVGYDDEESILTKGEYARKKGLGGLSFWSIDQDDSKALCGSVAYPLIKAGRQGFFKKAEAPKPLKLQSASMRTSEGSGTSEDNSAVNPSPERVVRPVTKRFADFNVESNDPVGVGTFLNQLAAASRGHAQAFNVWITTNVFNNPTSSMVEMALKSNPSLIHEQADTSSHSPSMIESTENSESHFQTIHHPDSELVSPDDEDRENNTTPEGNGGITATDETESKESPPGYSETTKAPDRLFKQRNKTTKRPKIRRSVQPKTLSKENDVITRTKREANPRRCDKFSPYPCVEENSVSSQSQESLAMIGDAALRAKREANPRPCDKFSPYPCVEPPQRLRPKKKPKRPRVVRATIPERNEVLAMNNDARPRSRREAKRDGRCPLFSPYDEDCYTTRRPNRPRQG